MAYKAWVTRGGASVAAVAMLYATWPLAYYGILTAIAAVAWASMFPQVAVDAAFRAMTATVNYVLNRTADRTHTSPLMRYEEVRRAVNGSRAALTLLESLDPACAHELNIFSDDALSVAVFRAPPLRIVDATVVAPTGPTVRPLACPGFEYHALRIGRPHAPGTLWLEVLRSEVRAHATLQWVCDMAHTLSVWVDRPRFMAGERAVECRSISPISNPRQT